MKSDDTIALVQRAKKGDGQARDDLIARYYSRWLDRFHGDLGTTLRSLHSTQDIVQSALLDAVRGLGNLRNEGAFFAWVTMIIKHKIAEKRKRVRARGGRKVGARGSRGGLPDLPDPAALPPGAELADLEEYSQVTEAILVLFPTYPRPMAAVALRYLWGSEIEEVMAQLGGVSRRSVWLWLRQGLDLLRKRLEGEGDA
jgi:DNA-directed RNA polymerase specialized sigma24 family protein